MENTHNNPAALLNNSDYPAMVKYTDPRGGNEVAMTFLNRDTHAAWLNMYRAKNGADPVIIVPIVSDIEEVNQAVEAELEYTKTVWPVGTGEEPIELPAEVLEEPLAVDDEPETFDGTFAPEELFVEEVDGEDSN